MLFVHRTPAPPLDAFVACVWYCENPAVPHALERVLPNGSAQLIVNLREDRTRMYHPESGAVAATCGTVLSGIASRFGIIDTEEQECVAGVSFRPGGTTAFFPAPAHEMRDCDIPLEFLWGRGRVQQLRERLLAAPDAAAKIQVLETTMAEAWTPFDLHPAVSFALDTFFCQPDLARIATVADRVGLSSKRFIERFKSTVGLTPKHYCRLLRFQRSLALAERGRRIDWTRIAQDCGYFDQAHFVHDFRDFAGITPTGYDAGRTQFRNHVKILQADPAAK